MRWKKPKIGDVKVKKKFALLPICINGETRWLEWVTVKYVYRNTWFNGAICYDWDKDEFIDE